MLGEGYRYSRAGRSKLGSWHSAISVVTSKIQTALIIVSYLLTLTVLFEFHTAPVLCRVILLLILAINCVKMGLRVLYYHFCLNSGKCILMHYKFIELIPITKIADETK